MAAAVQSAGRLQLAAPPPRPAATRLVLPGGSKLQPNELPMARRCVEVTFVTVTRHRLTAVVKRRCSLEQLNRFFNVFPVFCGLGVGVCIVKQEGDSLT